MGVGHQLRGVLFLSLLTLFAAISAYVILPLAIVGIAASGRMRRGMAYRVQGVCNAFCTMALSQWFVFAAAMIRGLYGTHIVVYTDGPLENIWERLPGGKTRLLLSNHRTRLDWMFLWGVYGHDPSLKIAMKDVLAMVPIFGWSMQMCRFLFLHRQLAADLTTIADYSRALRRPDDRTTLLVFPEGTNMSANTLAKSQQFARSKGKSVMMHVLTPRVRGTEALAEGLGPALHNVVDITMAYEGIAQGMRIAESSLFNGTMPSMVHVFCQRRAAPAQTAWESWLDDSYALKERILGDYYTSAAMGKPKSFVDALRDAGVRGPIVQRNNPIPTRALVTMATLYAVVAMWTGFLIWRLPYAVTATYAALLTAFYVVAGHRQGIVRWWLRRCNAAFSAHVD